MGFLTHPLSDGAALVALYDATAGDNWNTRDRWLSTDPIGQWQGVTTDAAGRVNTLDLSCTGLSGELPEELEYLTELNLSDNGLSGTLPTTLGSLTALTDLWLHDNQFGSELPAALGNLSNLESVTIWGRVGLPLKCISPDYANYSMTRR